MKLLVIGLGSMGKRRIRLIKNNFNNYEVIGVDHRLDRCEEVKEKFNIKCYKFLDEAIKYENPNSAFICTSPISHSEIIINCLKNNLNVFTEINLLNDRYEEIINLAKEKKLNSFLSSTFLYRKEIQYIQNQIKDSNDKYNYRYHVGQYLPDWHPWESYKEFFVGDKKTNGCRELFAIELPWIIKTFGKVNKINTIKDNISSLKLDYPDSYIVTFEHENGHKGVISVDVVSRKAIRDLEIYSQNNHILWKGTPETLQKYDIETKQLMNIDTYYDYTRDERYADNIIEDAYLDEIMTFFNMIENEDTVIRYSFEEDLYTISIIDEIEGDIN